MKFLFSTIVGINRELESITELQIKCGGMYPFLLTNSLYYAPLDRKNLLTTSKNLEKKMIDADYKEFLMTIYTFTYFACVNNTFFELLFF